MYSRWYNEFSKVFLERDYLVEGQTLDNRVDEICNKAEKLLNKPGFARRFKENLAKGWYSLSTPIWTNFGNDRGLPISCFSSYIEDNMESIALTHAEVVMMTKHGGGTAGYFGNLRGRGEKINKNGESAGSIHFMQLFDTLINIISQGRARRGNFGAYLPVRHKDILEFLTLRSEGCPIQDLSFGVCIDDEWMKDMIAGDSEKRKIWAKILECRINTGFPYIFFTDTVNNNTVDVYKDKKLNITHSNLCVAGNQRVVSNLGLLTAKELYENGENLLLFDNNKVVRSSPMKLVEKNADVYKITLNNGMTHIVTDYHKVKVRINNKNDTKDISCKDLKIGDKVAIQTNKGIFGTHDTVDEAFLLGLYQADGTQHDKNIMIDVWENNFDLLDEITEKFTRVCKKFNTQLASNNRVYKIPKFTDCSVRADTIAKKRLSNRALSKLGFKKGIVPSWIWTSNEESLWSYIRGLYYADGTAHVQYNESKGNPIQISLSNINKEFLQEVQLILANLGMQSSVRLLREAGKTSLPDGKGGHKEYNTKDCFRLIIGNKNDALIFNEKTGFLDRKNIKIENRDYRDNTKKFYKVDDIKYCGQEDVYCVTVDSKEHHWICNGIVTHNCSEICLPTNKDESFVCDLSSMNILYYDEWKNTDAVELLVYFLDAVQSEFIDKASKIKFMDRAVNFATRHRAIGIGWIGYHSYLQNNMIPFESMEAKYRNIAIAKTIKEQAYDASEKLAKEFGEPAILEGYGRRNTTLLAIAPTKSSAFILGQVSEGIEPHRTNYYIKDLQKGKFTIKNSALEKLLDKKGQNTADIWESILKNSGSVQHLSCLSKEEKDVFKTFSEISQKEIIIQAAQRQKYIDQSQSLNLMIHPSTPIKELNKLLIFAWENKIKTLYYQISINAAQQFSRNLLSCSACES